MWFNPLPSSLHCRQLYVNGVLFNFLMTGTVSCAPECTWRVQHVDMRQPWNFRTVKQLFIGSWSSFAVKHCLQGSEVQKQKYRLGREFCSFTLWDSKSLGRSQFFFFGHLISVNSQAQIWQEYPYLFSFFFLFILFPFPLLLWLLFSQLHFLYILHLIPWFVFLLFHLLFANIL